MSTITKLLPATTTAAAAAAAKRLYSNTRKLLVRSDNVSSVAAASRVASTVVKRTAVAASSPRTTRSYSTRTGSSSNSDNTATDHTHTNHDDHNRRAKQPATTSSLNTIATKNTPNYAAAAVTRPYGLGTFANLPFHPVLSQHSDSGSDVDPPKSSSSSSVSSYYDIAILGAPFDLGTTHRPGSRFGPTAIRQGSSHIEPQYNFSPYTHTNPLSSTEGLRVVDVGDAPLTCLDKVAALAQLERAHRIVSSFPSSSSSSSVSPPRILTLGGDHLTTLPALRAAHARWGPLSVIHFDAHIDTWSPSVLGGDVSALAGLNHGTFLHHAHEESLLIPDSSIHLGIRGALGDPADDMANDRRCGFETVTARDMDCLGVQGILDRVAKRVGSSSSTTTTNRVYISVDIDVLDPAFAPGTGTPEVGGWSTRELLAVLDGLKETLVSKGAVVAVGADVVEVAPAYDNHGAITALAAGEVVLALLRLMA